MKRRLLRVPFQGTRGLLLTDPVVKASAVLQYRIHLRKFWSAVKRLGQGENWEGCKAVHLGRMALLKEYAEIQITQQRQSYGKRRQHTKTEGRQFLRCFTCKRPGRLIRHHILQLQNGGPTITHNVLTICPGCHEEIHPWLKPPVWKTELKAAWNA